MHREKEEEKEGYVMRERAFSRFARTINLPANVGRRAKAKLEDGVLTINIPKEDEEKQKILSNEICMNWRVRPYTMDVLCFFIYYFYNYGIRNITSSYFARSG